MPRTLGKLAAQGGLMVEMLEMLGMEDEDELVAAATRDSADSGFMASRQPRAPMWPLLRDGGVRSQLCFAETACLLGRYLYEFHNKITGPARMM